MAVKIDVDSYDRLLYRNQFVIGPRPVDVPSWVTISIRPTVAVTAHPDLLWYQAVDGRRSVTLLGFMLDPEDEQRTDRAIVDDLLECMHSVRAVIEGTYRYGGRWLLIADDGEHLVAFNDAAGLRQVFYVVTAHGLWCASQPGILAQILGLEIAPDALEYIDSYGVRRNPEYWWPGWGSPVTGVRHLLPNHALDVTRGTVERYWPDRALATLSLEEAVDTIARTLRGIVKSAANRFELAVGVTAGWDSRLALAASRDVANRVSFMTVRQLAMRDDHPDVAVPSALLSRLGLTHDVVKSSHLLDPEFVRIFRTNYMLAHDHYAPAAQAILRYYGLRKANLTGHVSEAIRDPTMGNRPISAETTDQEIATAWHRTDAAYATRAIQEWRASMGQRYNVSADVLFYWEQRVANWLAMTQLEFDIAWKEIVSLYNCRELLITMLGVDEAQRGVVLYTEVAQRLWPEVLREPVNPHKADVGAATEFTRQMKRLVLGLPPFRRWRTSRA